MYNIGYALAEQYYGSLKSSSLSLLMSPIKRGNSAIKCGI